MKRFATLLIVLGILFGLGWFAIFAHGVVDASRADGYKQELKAAKLQVTTLQSGLADRIRQESEKREKIKGILLATYPSKSEEITSIFNSVNEPKKEEAPAAAPIAAAPAAPAPAATPATVAPATNAAPAK